MVKTVVADDQFKFLITCIKYSSNGKVDFQQVATECGIVSKGAAAKRYERMMKANGIHQSQGPTGRDTGVLPLGSKRDDDQEEGDGASPSKKRKRAAVKPAAVSLAPKKTGKAGGKKNGKRNLSMTETEEDEDDAKTWEKVKQEQSEDEEIVKEEDEEEDPLAGVEVEYGNPEPLYGVVDSQNGTEQAGDKFEAQVKDEPAEGPALPVFPTP